MKEREGKEMVEPCLCIVTVGKIFGIKLNKLTKLEVADWKFMLSPTFDFCTHLPATMMSPFVLDSKIYMAAGVLGYYRYKSMGRWIPSYKIYGFETDDIDDKRKKPRLYVAKSIPDAPVPFAESFIANISGDVYFFQCPRLLSDVDMSLWVLRSAHKEWEVLSLPSPLEECGVRSCRMFVLQDKIFLAANVEGKPYLASFDAESETWTQEDNNIFDGISLLCLPPCISVSVPGPSSSDRSVTLSWSSCSDPDPGNISGKSLQEYIRICALLVNRQKGVLLHQQLDECFEGIQPTIVCGSGRYTLVDLGNGKLCALLYGLAAEYDHGQSPILCISVFTLSMAKDFIDTDSAAPQQRFLSIVVHSKSLYTMKNHCGADEYLQHAFICPPKNEGRFHHMTSILWDKNATY